jgi:hypothetical protein
MLVFHCCLPIPHGEVLAGVVTTSGSVWHEYA